MVTIRDLIDNLNDKEKTPEEIRKELENDLIEKYRPEIIEFLKENFPEEFI